MTRIELIIRMIDGDLEAAHRVIYEDRKCSAFFFDLARFDFPEVDIKIWETIRDHAFECLIANECEKLKQIRNPQSFDSWLQRTVTRNAKRNHEEILEKFGVTSRPNPDVVIITVKSLPPEEDSVSDIGSAILAEIYDARNDTELVKKLIEDYSSASFFGSKAQPTYAKILELKIVQKMSDKDIAREIGVSHKNMSNLTTRAMTSLTAFVIKKIKGYEQKNQ